MAKLDSTGTTPRAAFDPKLHARERRRFPRVLLEADVFVEAETEQSLFKSRLRDLSENGVFIRTTNTRPLGTGVRLRIEIVRRDLRVVVRGIVVHLVDARDETDAAPAGMGVMFTEVDPSSQAALRAMIAMGSPLD